MEGTTSLGEELNSAIRQNKSDSEIAKECVSNLEKIFDGNVDHLAVAEYYLQLFPSVEIVNSLSKVTTQCECWNLLSIHSVRYLEREQLEEFQKYLNSIESHLVKLKISEFFPDTSSRRHALCVVMMHILSEDLDEEEVRSFLSNRDIATASLLLKEWSERVGDQEKINYLFSSWNEIFR